MAPTLQETTNGSSLFTSSKSVNTQHSTPYLSLLVPVEDVIVLRGHTLDDAPLVA